jgi:hypothetical protein
VHVDSAETQGQPHEIDLVRFVFALPSPLPVPDGWIYATGIPDGDGVPEPTSDPLVALKFFQVEADEEVLRGPDLAVYEVERRLGRVTDPSADENTSSAQRVRHTVVEAVTEADSPDAPPPGWDGQPQNLPPRSDPLMRCLHVVSQVARAFRLVDGDPIVIPTYERLPMGLAVFTGTGQRQGTQTFVPSGAQAWAASWFMVLEHFNLPDPLQPSHPWPEVEEESGQWMRGLLVGNPFVLYRERMFEARLAMNRLGDYASAVVLANTASEILLDALLTALLWEEHVRNELQPRLKGDWTKPASPWESWLDRAQGPRHRIVHAGHQPTRQEAADALNAVDALQAFLFDKVVQQRGTYPRVTMITVARAGLESRGVWSGQIKRFVEQRGATEPNWADTFSEWNTEIVTARATSN